MSQFPAAIKNAGASVVSRRNCALSFLFMRMREKVGAIPAPGSAQLETIASTWIATKIPRINQRDATRWPCRCKGRVPRPFEALSGVVGIKLGNDQIPHCVEHGFRHWQHRVSIHPDQPDFSDHLRLDELDNARSWKGADDQLKMAGDDRHHATQHGVEREVHDRVRLGPAVSAPCPPGERSVDDLSLRACGAPAGKAAGRRRWTR